jgi:hypothetical protein
MWPSSHDPLLVIVALVRRATNQRRDAAHPARRPGDVPDYAAAVTNPSARHADATPAPRRPALRRAADPTIAPATPRLAPKRPVLADTATPMRTAARPPTSQSDPCIATHSALALLSGVPETRTTTYPYAGVPAACLAGTSAQWFHAGMPPTLATARAFRRGVPPSKSQNCIAPGAPDRPGQHDPDLVRDRCPGDRAPHADRCRAAGHHTGGSLS